MIGRFLFVCFFPVAGGRSHGVTGAAAAAVVGWICFIRRPACLSETFFFFRFFSLAVIVDVCMYNGRVSALLCLFARVCVHPSPSAVRRIPFLR